MHYVIIPEIEAKRCNMRQGSWLVSPLCLTATWGLVHALGRELRDAEGNPAKRFAHIHHEHRYNVEEIGYDKKPHQTRLFGMMGKDKAPNLPMATPLEPSLTGDITVSLILEYESHPPRVEELEDWLHGKRVAGGSITDFGEILKKTEISEALEASPFGYVTMDQSHQLQEKGADRLEKLMELCSKTRGGKSREEEKPQMLAPAALGYATISEVKDRDGSRNGYPHAFADTLVGLVGMKKTTEINPDGDKIFWEEKWKKNKSGKSLHFVLESGLTIP
jgi:CRISPR-associated protein Csy2